MYLDLIIAVPILWGMFRGFRRGLIIELCTLIALILGVYGAAAFGELAGDYLEAQFHTDPRLSQILAFSLVFILIVIAVFSFGKILERLIKLVALGLFNKLFGMVFGGLKFALILSGLFFMLNGFSLTENLISPQARRDSLLYTPVEGLTPKLLPFLKRQSLPESVDKKIDAIQKEAEQIN